MYHLLKLMLCNLFIYTQIAFGHDDRSNAWQALHVFAPVYLMLFGSIHHRYLFALLQRFHDHNTMAQKQIAAKNVTS